MYDFDLKLFETARSLAKSHLESDEKTTKVLYYPPRPTEAPVVRLLEVSGSCPTLNEVLPVAFAADPDDAVPYPSVIILMSESDFAALRSAKLQLPPDWGSTVIDLTDLAA
jgi:hypothetical protein